MLKVNEYYLVGLGGRQSRLIGRYVEMIIAGELAANI